MNLYTKIHGIYVYVRSAHNTLEHLFQAFQHEHQQQESFFFLFFHDAYKYIEIAHTQLYLFEQIEEIYIYKWQAPRPRKKQRTRKQKKEKADD